MASVGCFLLDHGQIYSDQHAAVERYAACRAAGLEGATDRRFTKLCRRLNDAQLLEVAGVAAGIAPS